MDPERKGEEGFPPASAAAGDDFSFEAFREWLKKCKGAAGMQQLDSNAEYQLWLAGACPLVEGSVNVAQLSANTGLLAGYRAVNSYALEEKARQLSQTKEWPTDNPLRLWREQRDASEQDACPAASGEATSEDVPPPPLVLPPLDADEPPAPPSRPMAPMETKLAYVSGHHRGCALHALFFFHRCTGQAPPEWLVRMGQHVPAQVESGMNAEAAAIQGIAATAKAQHGTTGMTYLDIVRVLGASGACRGLSAEQMRNKLTQEIPAFVEKMAPEGWVRFGIVASRVCSGAMDRLCDFADKWGIPPIPMKWWRDTWMLLPSQDRDRGKVGDCVDDLSQTLLVRRLLAEVAELIEELIQKGELERHEVPSKLTGILFKARFTSERRKALRDLCVKYSSGMAMAVQKHNLEASVVQEMHQEFCQGLADAELEAVTVPSLFWPVSKFVAQKLKEAEVRNSESERLSLVKNLADARNAVQADVRNSVQTESMGRHAEWIAACRLHTHELKVAVGKK